MRILVSLMGCVLEAEVGAECLRLSEVMAQPWPDEWSAAELGYGTAWSAGSAQASLSEPPDWVELCNVSDSVVDSGWYRLVGVNPENPYVRDDAWPLPDGSIAPGACIVILLEPGCEAFGCANFDLQQENGFLRLEPDGESRACVDHMEYVDDQAHGVSLAFADGEWQRENFPTPGERNR